MTLCNCCRVQPAVHQGLCSKCAGRAANNIVGITATPTPTNLLTYGLGAILLGVGIIVIATK